jgi:hypothetical protein
MARQRFVQIDGKLIPADEYTELNSNANYYIVPDYKPYKSMKTGEMIEGRSQHREHLKRYGLIEVGNDSSVTRKKPSTPAPGLKQRLVEVFNSKL